MSVVPQQSEKWDRYYAGLAVLYAAASKIGQPGFDPSTFAGNLNIILQGLGDTVRSSEERIHNIEQALESMLDPNKVIEYLANSPDDKARALSNKLMNLLAIVIFTELEE